MVLEDWGWGPAWHEKALSGTQDRTGLVPARIRGIDRQSVRLVTAGGFREGSLTGALLRDAREGKHPVAVGDWVLCRDAGPGSGVMGVHVLLERVTWLRRKEVISGGRKVGPEGITGGRTLPQAIAANVDRVFVVMPLSARSTPGEGLSRLERTMVACADGGVEAVALFTKTDLVPSDILSESREIAEAVCPRVIGVSAWDGSGMEGLSDLLGPGSTAAFTGPSGAGKTTLINALMAHRGAGDLPELPTGALSDSTGKGRHVTTWREMFLLPGGGLVVDTPGMRELALWADSEDMDDAFPDIAALADKCRFRDCRHLGEPGCAVQEALESGELDGRRWDNWVRMHREVEHLDDRRIALYQKGLEKERRWLEDGAR